MDTVPYPALLTLHLLAIAVFLAGLALAAGSLPGLATGRPNDARRRELDRVRAINLWVTTPALLLVWALGIAMAIAAGWYASGWLHAKIVLVLILSALHGRQTARLRRLAQGRPARTSGYIVLAVIAVLVTAIVALAVGKPF